MCHMFTVFNTSDFTVNNNSQGFVNLKENVIGLHETEPNILYIINAE